MSISLNDENEKKDRRLLNKTYNILANLAFACRRKGTATFYMGINTRLEVVKEFTACLYKHVFSNRLTPFNPNPAITHFQIFCKSFCLT